ncbi:bifunctional D-glycero-beta-D-manno-heptose-7-phosphate kinase/D-glycero-beta-D-manno-heptose 1-phosphate adenylyltransferase HldE [Paraferrimonas sedimenticola]|uniref:Bifunctional protein HldE n=1 Tax=Paraferrimonas sedimenticola TaxID=375674 RepID=A0AA37W0Y8_9GAMM|nr:bifunctional D-glycero-beta-D-manno-heptose-7-phosphate kinase/D-glycero-beta-D-manno-heptose 1-phosphate adenylyltransferase HldE [Paraferrimonas sedimenticola]GLP95667.1 bifunctional protein HldE [Paraferrimonas sedimenticola]
MMTALPPFEQAKVLVLGDVMLDRYWVGPTSRISPEAPVPVVKVEQLEDRPGGAANVAFNVAALGGEVSLAGLVGEDEAATALKVGIEALGVKSALTAVSDAPTITKLRILSANQQLLRLDFEDAFAQSAAQDLMAHWAERLDSVSVLVLSDYAKGTLASPQTLIKAAKAKGVEVVVDPKGTDFARYRGASLLTPNMSEFEAVVGKVTGERDLYAKGQALLAELELKALLVTRSENGMTLLQADQPAFHIATQAKEVFDVTGAGDTVVATLAASLASGASLKDACALANAAAGVVVGKVGTSTVSHVELAEALAISHGEGGFGVVSQAQMRQAIKAAKQRGERVVMTNGCFDILHAGHVSYLQQAKALGDRLIVAVNDDDSVRRLKGDGRPVNPVGRRMAVLDGLGSVDWVIPFSEDTPQRVISELLPDILVKGGDYKVDQIAGAKEVMANGGEVKVLGFEDGCSTSAIIEQIIEKGQ